MAHSAMESESDRSRCRAVRPGITGTMATVPQLSTPRSTSPSSRLGSPAEHASSSAHPSAISALSRLKRRPIPSPSARPVATLPPRSAGVPRPGDSETHTTHPHTRAGQPQTTGSALRSPPEPPACRVLSSNRYAIPTGSDHVGRVSFAIDHLVCSYERGDPATKKRRPESSRPFVNLVHIPGRPPGQPPCPRAHVPTCSRAHDSRYGRSPVLRCTS